ncbi:hypothetical protein GQ53DRAFT_888842 [Thozetella sp. PMI_491]|nr:hypothetical protein GQ53DRAFT_888842 [Thozetella sp. PMI_491]
MSNATKDYGDLRATLTSAYDWVWSDTKSGASRDVTIWHPKSQGDMRPLGSVGTPGYPSDISGKQATLLVGKNPNAPGSPAVASPTGYTLIWKDEGSKGKHNGAFWRPTAPSGYVSLGDVCTGNWSTPSRDKIWCVRSDLVRDSLFEAASFWDDKKSGSKKDCSVWQIEMPNIGLGGTEKLPIIADTFRATDGYTPPNGALASLPTLLVQRDFKEFTAPLPDISKETLPEGGHAYDDLEQCRATLPFIAFFPKNDRASLANIKNPFCTVIRNIAWYVPRVHTNKSNGQISDSTTITKGVSATQSKEMTESAGVSISSSFGIKGFGLDMSLNYQFSTTSSSSYTEYEEVTQTKEFTVPAYSATVVLAKRIRIKATRSDGTIELRELHFMKNEDITLVGVSLLQGAKGVADTSLQQEALKKETRSGNRLII